jgi:hypothetical protein
MPNPAPARRLRFAAAAALLLASATFQPAARGQDAAAHDVPPAPRDAREPEPVRVVPQLSATDPKFTVQTVEIGPDRVVGEHVMAAVKRTTASATLMQVRLRDREGGTVRDFPIDALSYLVKQAEKARGMPAPDPNTIADVWVSIEYGDSRIEYNPLRDRFFSSVAGELDGRTFSDAARQILADADRLRAAPVTVAR